MKAALTGPWSRFLEPPSSMPLSGRPRVLYLFGRKVPANTPREVRGLVAHCPIHAGQGGRSASVECLKDELAPTPLRVVDSVRILLGDKRGLMAAVHVEFLQNVMDVLVDGPLGD